MLRFNSDYTEGAHPEVLQHLIETNLCQTPGYGTDEFCMRAAGLIKDACDAPNAAVHFLVGGTQANFTVIAAALRPHQGVLSSDQGHIHVHETGAVEATGHKVLALPHTHGKITASQVAAAAKAQKEDDSFEHIVQPKMVYLSHPTEFGTLYSKEELCEMRKVCDEYGLYLFIDGARLGFGITAESSDVGLKDLAKLCDVFYIGGTKLGALFGEAVVILNDAIKEDFRYLIKQRGGMLAKGRLLGVQFEAMFTDGLYERIGRHGNAMAAIIRDAIVERGYEFMAPPVTNQLFPIFPCEVAERLSREFAFTDMGAVGEGYRAVRFCTSWATTEEAAKALAKAILES
ncbi:MAG: aminotransferase class I/II-fold pyridoxal phosphate-dependent enzyme [Clostridiales bacterium]|nr:aminotransferase class I/II-fold pyridoxal phosphate-dependent enzyme [Clostridiales bacterium]